MRSEPIAVPESPDVNLPGRLRAGVIKTKSDTASDDDVQAVPEEPPTRPLVSPKQRVPKSAAPLRVPAPRLAEQPKSRSPLLNAPFNSVAYRPPRPTRQVLPNISSLPSGILTQTGQLEVLVKLDETGRVTDAQALPEGKRISQMLVGSAIAAARQWTFEPATLRGKAVPSQHSIIFQFAGRQ